MTRNQRIPLLSGIVAGVVYGLIAYLSFERQNALPTASFLFGVPLVMGAIPLLFRDDDQAKLYSRFIFIPWISIFTLLALLMAFLHEGVLCIVVLAAPLIAITMVVTFVMWLVKAERLRASKKAKAAAGAALMLLPFLLVPVEKAYFMPAESETVRSSIVVDAPASFVWEHLAAVSTIQNAEYHPGLFNLIGVPRPIRATVDKAALGGHRVGEFEQGLRFQELITAYDVPVKMTFSIAVDPKQLREGSMERHAFEKGYFGFIDATYELEPLGPNRTRLSLSSAYTLKTGVNAYGRLWAHAVVSDFQDRVLDILKQRCEPKATESVAAGK